MIGYYLSPKPSHFLEWPQYFQCIFGINRQVGKQFEALNAGCLWMLENNRFTKRFTESKWLHWLNRLEPWRDTCIAIVVPDVPFSAAGTLEQFRQYSHVPKMHGYPVALVTQNGMTINDITWNEIDTLFLGGDDEHKRGVDGQRLAFEAKHRGKWLHIGRCNSGQAMVEHWPYADSWDGTTLAKHPHQQVKSIITGIESVRNGRAYKLGSKRKKSYWCQYKLV